MADVRLTATNPEDSTVVPVACDASGRLLLQDPEVVEGPQGETGPEGPKGEDGQDGDPFSGNFAGDVTFGGNATFAGSVTTDGVFNLRNNNESANIALDGANNKLEINTLYGNDVVFQYTDTGSASSVVEKIRLAKDGSATFAGQVDAGGLWSDTADKTQNFVSRLSGANAFKFRSNTGFGSIVDFHSQGSDSSSIVAKIEHDGSATFAGGKAGFTAEGYLWCTTRRGDTVILDATAGGMGSWADYTPTTRIDEIRDKLDANRGDTGEMHADTP